MRSDLHRRYATEVLRFRGALNLTSVTSESQFMARFVDPSIELSRWMPDQGRLLDIGSGMGIPGVPVLISKPGIQGVLVERRKKRAEFLRHLIRLLKLDAEVYDADINDLPMLGIDICVARAVTRIEDLLIMCGRHANLGATAILPVPFASEPVLLDGWELEGRHIIDAIEKQQVHCYRFVGDQTKEGDVSRETY